MIEIRKLLKDNHIPFWEEGTNVQAGWVNIQCPLCDDHSNHGGFNPYNASYRCWRCGSHFIDKVLSKVLSISRDEAQEIINEYSVNSVARALNKKKIERPAELIWPQGLLPDFPDQHRKYLESRNFDPDKLIKDWNLKATGHLGDYKFRIIAPIFLNGIPASYQGRDITGKSELRYKTCPPENEVIFHKNIVYGIDYVQNRKAIICEGITDVWRMGKGAVATFGTSFLPEQMLFLTKHIDEAFVLFDSDDSSAQDKAARLCWELSVVGIKTIQVELESGDPGELSEDDVKQIKKELKF